MLNSDLLRNLRDSKVETDTLSSSLLKHILATMEFEVRNVHIRYQDATSIPGHPYSFGFTLIEISVVNNGPIRSNISTSQKHAIVRWASVYWNSDDVLWENKTNDELNALLQGSISLSNLMYMNYLLAPFSFNCSIVLYYSGFCFNCLDFI